MTRTVFFSWQSDTSTTTGRNLIERALNQAISAVGDEAAVEEVVREGLELDRDTKGVSGSPPIVETIFKKIDAAAVFVADLTFAGRRPNGDPTPNPNVLIEYGWALKILGHGRIIPVMNTVYGDPTTEQMPFDLRHLRHPIQYACPEGADEGTRKQARRALASALERAIRDVLESAEYRASLPKPPEPATFNAKLSLDGEGRFRARGDPLGERLIPVFGESSPGSKLFLREGPALWLRVMPLVAPGKIWPRRQLREAATESGGSILPIIARAGGYGYMAWRDGFGIYGGPSEGTEETSEIVFLFDTGEIWSVDTYYMSATRSANPRIPMHEKEWAGQLDRYAETLLRLGIRPPYRWMMGMEDTNGRGLFVSQTATGANSYLTGRCFDDQIVKEGTYNPNDSSAHYALLPFFRDVYAKCDVARPRFLDETL